MMRFLSFHLFPAIVLFLFSVPCVNAQAQPTYGKRAQWLMRRAESLHAAPREVDDTFSADLFVTFFNELDPNGYFFSAADIASFKGYEQTLDDHIKTGDDEFINAVSEMYEQRVHWADSLCKAELSKPFDYAKDDMMPIRREGDVLVRNADMAGLALHWKQYMKSTLLETLYQMHHDSAGYDAAKVKAAMADEPNAREKVKRLTQRRISKKLEDPRKYVGEALLKAMAELYDPHSAYFSPLDESDFENALSADALSLGIELKEEESGEVTIDKLVPGGPAWKSGELHKGDVLLSIQGEFGRPQDLTLAGEEEVKEILSTMGDEEITLTVRKSNGLESQVTLVQEKIRTQDNVVRSLVIEGEKKTGYISLPGFYTEWDEEGGSTGCANDVAREILKLKKDGVEGIILDLRFNGGGSIKEAAELAGIFIDAGPLWVGRDNDDVRSTHKDPNRGAMWDGPLVLMVNGGSASASEFIAGTLQDHGRAIIVGSRTYGKATGQVIVPLDPERQSTRGGYLKITTQKFYHLDGKSHQLTGITPDVEIEDPLQPWMDMEEQEPFALPADTIMKKMYYTPQVKKDLTQIQEESRQRILAEPRHRAYLQVVNAINQFREEHRRVNLTPQGYFDYLEDYEGLSKAWDNMQAGSGETLLKVKNNSFDAALYSVDEYAREVQKTLQENIRQDLYLRECVRILESYIRQ